MRCGVKFLLQIQSSVSKCTKCYTGPRIWFWGSRDGVVSQSEIWEENVNCASELRGQKGSSGRGHGLLAAGDTTAVVFTMCSLPPGVCTSNSLSHHICTSRNKRSCTASVCSNGKWNEVTGYLFTRAENGSSKTFSDKCSSHHVQYIFTCFYVFKWKKIHLLCSSILSLMDIYFSGPCINFSIISDLRKFS